MFLGHSPLDFLIGFDYAAIALGLAKEVEQKDKLCDQIVIEHGWEYNPAQHVSGQLEAAGFGRTFIVNEVLGIEIEAWKRLHRSLCEPTTP